MAASENYRFFVHFLSSKERLKDKRYQTVDQLKHDAFALFKQVEFHDHNAIITYLNEQQQEVLLTSLPPPLTRREYRDLFIKFLYPSCAMCSNSFGILSDQLVYECPTDKCGEQYCGKCVQSIQGPTSEHPFTCMACQQIIQPKRSELIERHLMWPSVSQVYGTENLTDYRNGKHLSAQSIVRDMEFRKIHLQSRLNTFRNNLLTGQPTEATAENFINEVADLCHKIENLIHCVKDIQRVMCEHDLDLEQIAINHQDAITNFDNLCDKLTFYIEQLQAAGDDPIRDDLRQSFLEHKLARLPTDHNVQTIDRCLLDVNARKQWMNSNVETLELLLTDENSTSDDTKLHLYYAKEKIEEFDRVLDQLDCLRGNYRAIERFFDRCIDLLKDERQPDIVGSRFIYLLETLRIENDRLEIKRNFPHTTQLITHWQQDYGTENYFKPKVLSLCQHIEQDLKDLFTEERSINSVPYRIGVIGHTSVGKSALIMKLADLTDYSSMINLERSTFGYLQFDARIDEDRIPLSYIDIAGSTDNDASRSIGNYLELIGNADCDVYMLVFDKPFDEKNQIWLEYIEKNLGRKCLLVRSKSDLAFDEFYRDATGGAQPSGTPTRNHVRSAIQKVREHATKTWDSKTLEKEIFLAAAGRRSNEATADQFDLDKLRAELYRAARTDLRMARVCHLAIMASKTAINTCFRRGYVVSKTKYRLLSAGASLVPLLDEIPAFFGREEIRQAFGVHDRSSLSNFVHGTTNALEQYLSEHKLEIPKDELKSGYFQYLVPKKKEKRNSSAETTSVRYGQNRHSLSLRPGSSTGPVGTNAIAYSLAAAGVAGRLFDEGVRAAMPITSAAVRTVSIAGVVVSVVLAPIFAAWSYHSSGKRMNRHLHLLCDDLQIVFIHLIDQLCSSVNEK